jgi:asparagine synthase (glutamine-hydrolysing)
MEFYLKINTRSLSHFNSDVLRVSKKEDLKWVENQLAIINEDDHTKIICSQSKNKIGWLIGDPVFEKDNQDLLEKYLEEAAYLQLLETVQGHYRLIVYDREKITIRISSSLFGILPVYYAEEGEIKYASSDVEILSDCLQKCSINKRFVLENILFFYQLFDNTVYKQIKLLHTHHVLEITHDGLRFSKYLNISDWFSSNPKHWKKSAGYLSDIFINRARHYFPDEPFVMALTGGFDSRTLVGCGLYHKKIFETYGFGNGFSDDIQIATQLAIKANLKFNYIQLNQEYIGTHSLQNGLEFISNSAGTAGFARAHYLFACKNLQAKTKYIVTGNFGSEIFRAVHNTGAVISDNLQFLFIAKSFDSAIKKIENSQEFLWINKQNFEKEWSELKADLSKLPSFNKDYSYLKKNEIFYLFVFEEVFRKYFGAEMVNQFKYLNNRTPFLDSVFLKEILKTGLAGVYSDFRERNPVKRFKGQVLYAHIIQKTFPAFSGILTNKGYCPEDLLSLKGKLHITMEFLRKKLNKENNSIDPNSVDDAFSYNQSFFQKQPIDNTLFNTCRFSDAFNSKKQSHDFLLALSQSWYINSLSGKSKKLQSRDLLSAPDFLPQ